MANAVNTITQPAAVNLTPSPIVAEIMAFVGALAVANGTTPAGLIAELVAPFEKEMADRIADGVISRLKNTAEIGQQNADLQADFDLDTRKPS